MLLKHFQAHDLARAGLRDGAIIAWEPGLGKSFAAFSWPLLKQARRTLIVAPGSLHHQLTTTAASHFGIFLRTIESPADIPRYHLDKPHTSRTPQFFLTTYTALSTNHSADEWTDTFGHKGIARPNRALHRSRRAFTKRHHLRPNYTNIGTTHHGITCLWKPCLARLLAIHDSFDCVILDEGTKIQATESKVASSIRLLQPRFRLVLTATPVKNRLDSLFWLAAWAAPENWPYPPTPTARKLFTSTHLQTERFLTRETNMRSRGDPTYDTTRTSNSICSLHKLWKTLSPVIIRRRKDNCQLDIPPKIVNPILVPPGTAQLAVYRYHLDNPPIRSKKGGRALHKRVRIGMQLTLLRQAALCPRSPSLLEAFTGAEGPRRSWTDYTPKLAAIINIIQELVGDGKQVIVGSPFRDFTADLAKRLTTAELSPLILDGTISPKERGLRAAEFKARKHPVLLAGLKAMGEGHSFEQCSHLILPGLSYAYDENEQFIHRIWRLNSPGPVTIYPIITRGTIDEHLHRIFHDKSASASLALDARLPQSADCLDSTEIDAPDPETLLGQIIAAFNPSIPTIDEESLLLEYESTLLRQIALSALRYTEHHPPILPGHAITPSDLSNASQSLTIPSPTQLTVNLLRKHYAAGTYRKADPAKLTLKPKK
jgi:SNF2 family DNA or RNA helicase